MPGVRLAAGQAGAVDTALLARPYADSLTVHRVADRVGLGVFEGDERDNQVPLGALRELPVGSDHILQQVGPDLELVAALLKGDPEDLLRLLGRGYIVRVNLDDVIVTIALALENVQSLLGVAGGDDAYSRPRAPPASRWSRRTRR